MKEGECYEKTESSKVQKWKYTKCVSRYFGDSNIKSWLSDESIDIADLPKAGANATVAEDNVWHLL